MDPVSLTSIAALARKYWWVLAIVVVAVLAMIFGNKLIDDYGDSREEVGKQEERTKSLEGVIEDVKTADEAEKYILDADTIGKYCQCVRSARTPANCTKFLPDVYTDNGGAAPRCEGRAN